MEQAASGGHRVVVPRVPADSPAWTPGLLLRFLVHEAVSLVCLADDRRSRCRAAGGPFRMASLGPQVRADSLGDRRLRLGSASLQRWLHHRIVELDRIEAAHRAVGGSKRGRRWATGHINQAYVVLLSSHFQGFCRDLHSECIDRLARSITPTALQGTLRSELFFARKLDRGNPTPGNIGSDFNRLGVSFWPEMRRRNVLNRTRQSRLDQLSRWRNAVAHQDFPLTLTPHFVTMRTIRSWRRACDALAHSSDTVMRDYLTEVTGLEPW